MDPAPASIRPRQLHTEARETRTWVVSLARAAPPPPGLCAWQVDGVSKKNEVLEEDDELTLTVSA